MPNSFIDDSVHIMLGEDKQFYVLNANYKIMLFNEMFAASEKTGNRYDYISILVTLHNSNSINKKELMSIILHEVQHAHDTFDYPSYSTMNSDTIMSDLLSRYYEPSKPKVIDYLINNRSLTYPDIKTYVRNFITEDIEYFFDCYVLYLCNKSEMKARLWNFKQEIEAVPYNDRREYIENNMCYKNDFFRKHSSIFNDYYIMHEILRALIETCPIETKRLIAGDGIKQIYDYMYKHNRINGYVYGRHFKNNMD